MLFLLGMQPFLLFEENEGGSRTEGNSKNHSEIIASLEETKALDDTLRQAILTAAEEYKGR